MPFEISSAEGESPRRGREPCVDTALSAPGPIIEPRWGKPRGFFQVKSGHPLSVMVFTPCQTGLRGSSTGIDPDETPYFLIARPFSGIMKPGTDD
jgi:hypothetical protein